MFTYAELAELPLIRLDFSCNKITTIPVCYRNLRHLQTITLDNNPLQSPPAQVRYNQSQILTQILFPNYVKYVQERMEWPTKYLPE